MSAVYNLPEHHEAAWPSGCELLERGRGYRISRLLHLPAISGNPRNRLCSPSQPSLRPASHAERRQTIS